MPGSVSLAQVIHLVFGAYQVLIIVRVILSYLRTPRIGSPWLPVWRFVYATTEPLLSPIRVALSRFQRGVPLDFSPLVLILLLAVAERLIIGLLANVR